MRILINTFLSLGVSFVLLGSKGSKTEYFTFFILTFISYTVVDIYNKLNDK